MNSDDSQTSQSDSVPTRSHWTGQPADASFEVTPPTELPEDSRFRPLWLHRDGGMGRIHVALDAELNRQVAFKEIQPNLADNPAVVEHFLFEAEVTGRLEHPGVVPVYGLGRYPDGRPYYAMRFIDGRSLRDAIRQFHTPADGPPNRADRALALRHLLSRFVAVCQTIAFAHSRGVIHRDLKPHNVLLGPFGETLVVDWGLAKRTEAGDDRIAASDLAATGTRIGTPAYWSPEQAAGLTDQHDERTDVYGLGTILYQLLTGVAPHPSGQHDPPPEPPKVFSPWVDDVLDGITTQSLARRPQDRFPSALALAEEVERWLADQPVAAQRSVVAALARRVAVQPDDTALVEQLARQRINLGLMLSGMGRDADAIEELEAAALAFATLSLADPSRPRYRAEEANCYIALAQPLANLGRQADAAAREKQATGIYNGLIAAHPEEYRANLASILVTHAGGAVVVPPPQPADAEITHRTHDGSRSAPATATPAPTTASRPPLPEPELLQGYAVLRTLGQGAFGQILLARDNALDRLVAIKDFRADLSDTARVRVVREMQVTARLIHPNIIRVYTYGMHASTRRPFLVMEYIPGKTLKEELLAFRGGRPVREDARFARLVSAIAQACEGIHFAHTQGVLHRDPKPSNVMVHEEGRAVVVDWGLAKVLGAAEPDARAELDAVPKVRVDFPEQAAWKPAANDPMLTQEGAVLGTPAYMAPEQGRGSAPSPRSDIYTLGAGLFELLTGEPPHTGLNLNEVMRQLLFGKIQRPRDLNPLVPVELEAVCAVAMARNPDDRYASAAVMAADLRAWLASQPLSIRNRGRLRRLWEQLTTRG